MAGLFGGGTPAPAPAPACEETYGLFPCSTSLGGTIILIFVYGQALLVGANLISDGSELLLEVMSPGLIGGLVSFLYEQTLVLPILGALPDAAMIVVSGLGGSVEEAQEQVAVGMGTLAGSTVMLLSIAWGGSLMVGRCDLVNGRAKDKTLTKGWRPGGNMRLSRHTVMDMLSETGVTTDDTTRQNAYIMVATSLLYLFPQVPAFLGEEHDPQAALMGCVACFVVLAAYCAFQVVAPELQKRKMKMAQKAYMRRQALNMAHSIAGSAGAVLIDQNGNIRDVALKALFEKFDEDRSGSIDHVELRKMAKMFLMSGPAAVQTPQQAQQAIDLFMHEMDTDNDGHITYDEMKTGLERWFRDLRTEKDAVALALRYSQQCPASSDRQSQAAVLLDPEQQLVAAAGFEEEEEEDDDEEDDEEEEELTPAQIKMKAAYKMLVGTLIVALVADPMVDAVAGLSTASGIPAFFVSFVITPFASNASELVSSLNFAKGKKVKNISLTYCQVYGAVAMNNTMCLGLFLMVVYARGLAWEFSSEVTTTMVAILALGLIACKGETFSLFWGLVSLLIYPASLGLVAYLDYGLGWK